MSLLSLQSGMASNPSASETLEAAKNRLISMMHLYDKLYRSDNFREISLQTFLPPLVNEIVEVVPAGVPVETKMNIDNIPLDAKILSSLGIILNELLTNSMKYAFVGRAKGLISLSASKSDHLITLVYEDDGIGIPENVAAGNTRGFGMQLVSMLVQQINGSLRIERQGGTRFTLEFEA